MRECLTGALVSSRSPTPGYASDDLFTGNDPYTRAMRSIIKPTFDVRVSSIGRQEDTPSEAASIRLYNVSVIVRVTYKLEDPVLFVSDYEDIKADAERDVDVFTRALGWPGALTQTVGGVPTRLVSGLLRSQSSTVAEEDPNQGLYSLDLAFSGVAVVDVNAP